MTYRVAPGREIFVNGRLFKPGEIVPLHDSELANDMARAGVLISDEPKRKEKKGIEE